MLDSLITSKTRIRLLVKFFLNYSMKASLHGLTEEFGESTNAIRLELNRMEEAGLLSAHKHVRSEKDKYSVQALLENNVLKARKLLDLLSEFPLRHFFCVSTDKAANPVNIMGASKKIMEDMIMAYSSWFKISTVRFANVAFSNGSLLAGFMERLMNL